MAASLKVFVFCSFTSNRQVGDTYVRGVGGWATGGSRAQVCSRKKNKLKWRVLEIISCEHRSQRDAFSAL